MSHTKNGDSPINTGSRLTEIADAGKKYSASVNSGVRSKRDYSHGTDDKTKHPVKLAIDLHAHEHDQKNPKHTHTSGLELASIHSKSLTDGTPESAKGLIPARSHSECKPQRRALVKQSTQGRFEIEEHIPTVPGLPRKSSIVTSTDFIDKVQSRNIEKKTDVVGVSDKPLHTGSLQKSPVKYDISKFQHSAPHPDHGLTSHGAVLEEIPLKEIKLRLGNSAVDVTDYRQKFNERIRLKEKSRSVDNSDSYQSTQLSAGESVIDRLRSAGNKVLAVCSVHVSDNSAGNVKSVHLSPEAAGRRNLNAKTTKDQKQYLSPDSYPSMLEKSKSFHRIVNPNQIATEVKRLVHQTSAERKRLANQSSTETSGLGETVTSGFSSQESIHSYHSGARVGNIEQSLQDQGIDLCEDTRNIRHEGNSTFGTRIIDSDNTINHTNEPKKGIICMYSVDDVDTSGVDRPVVDTNSQSVAPTGTCRKTSEKKVSGEKEMVNRQMTNRTIIGQSHLSSAYKPPLDFRSNDVKRPDNMPMFSANVGPDFDVLFTQSKNLKVPAQTVGLQLDQINNEWDKHKRGSSIKSRSSQGSFRSRSGSTRRSRRYLSHKESQWMKWGRERRMSLKKRVEKLDKPEPEIPRASTPVKKARQEGLMFVHPDLGSKYISEDDINYIRRHKQERLKTCKLIEKSKMKLHHEAHDINRLTPDELMTLSRFWEHRVFIRTRYVSILLSLVTTVIYVLSICSTQWVTYPSPEVMDHYAHEGLWFRCHPVQRNNRYTEICDDPTRRVDDTSYEGSLWENICEKINTTIRPMECKDSITNWQNAVIGLMIFSAAFGFVAAILAICGVCTSPLPKKIYYFHSAGEIFFVCALTTTVALIIYAIAISTDASIPSHTYGSGYGLGWGGTAFFFAASFCMSLDELVRESAQNRCCRYLCWRSRSNDRDNSQHV